MNNYLIRQLFLFVNLVLMTGGAYAAATSADPGIIPAPAEVKRLPGTFLLNKATVLLYNDRIAQQQAEYLGHVIERELALKPAIRKNNGTQGGSTIVFASRLLPDLGKEGYRLKITPGKIEISGAEAGLFYGLQSLVQLMEKHSGTRRLPCMEITDRPRYSYRGIMQDVGYHIFPVSFIKSQIDMLARYKMNVYHWHLTEDHGWRIEIKKYPKLTQIGSVRASSQISNADAAYEGQDHQSYGGYYTQEQIREVVAYAAARQVTIIPEIEMPGHSLAALASYPYLGCGSDPGPFRVAEKWGIYEDVYCAGKESTFRFLEDVLTEVMDLFPSKIIHIGGDECPKERWKKCTFCQKRIREQHLKDEFELQSYFIQRMERFLNKHGRTAIGWDEIMEGGLPENTMVMCWRDIKEGIKAAKQHHQVVMSPVTPLYFDYIQGKREQEPYAIEWGYNPLSLVYNYNPDPDELTAAEKKRIVGVSGAIWTEHMNTPQKVAYMLYPRLLALAEVAWTPQNRKDSVSFFEDRLPEHLAWLDGTRQNYRVPEAGGVADTTLSGASFKIVLKAPVKGARIFYNFDGQEPGEADYLYTDPVVLKLEKGEKRLLKTVVITPSGKRSVVTTSVFQNPG